MSDPKNTDRARIKALVAAECNRIMDSGTREQLERCLLDPRQHMLSWDYAREPTRYPAWLVADLRDGGISYCEHGFGPDCPWGLTDLDGGSAGMDFGWFSTLHAAFLASFGWKPREITLDPMGWVSAADMLSALFDALEIPPGIERSVESFATLIRNSPAGGISLPLQIYILSKPYPAGLRFDHARRVIEDLCGEGFSIVLIPRWVPSSDLLQAPPSPAE